MNFTYQNKRRLMTMAEKMKKPAAKKADESVVPKAAVRIADVVTPKKARDIGLDVEPPESSCDDTCCPFHGTLPVRGQTIVGTVTSDRMNKTVVVKKQFLRLIPKYERYEKRTRKYSAHNPPCIAAKAGDEVTIAECRPLSKTVSFVVVRRNK
jgi:small subunit ribosomal protein S17